MPEFTWPSLPPVFVSLFRRNFQNDPDIDRIFACTLFSKAAGSPGAVHALIVSPFRVAACGTNAFSQLVPMGDPNSKADLVFFERRRVFDSKNVPVAKNAHVVKGVELKRSERYGPNVIILGLQHTIFSTRFDLKLRTRLVRRKLGHPSGVRPKKSVLHGNVKQQYRGDCRTIQT